LRQNGRDQGDCWKAQIRLTKRFARLAAAGKDQRKIVPRGRELLGFIWAIESRPKRSKQRWQHDKRRTTTTAKQKRC